MTLDKAIKTQEDYLKKPWVKLPYYVRRGMELGIEALKIINELRLAGDPISPGLLPGETEE